MSHLVLLNGVPGVGKSTTAAALAEVVPRLSALDVDAIKHALPTWRTDPYEAGLEARKLAIADIERHLSRGQAVVVGQYLARTQFIEELEALAKRAGATFVEVVLDLDAAALASRIHQRSQRPTRPEHAINGEYVRPEHASGLLGSLEALRTLRPNAKWIAAEDVGETVRQIQAFLR